MKKKESALFFSYLCAHILQIAFLLLCFAIFAVILYIIRFARRSRFVRGAAVRGGGAFKLYFKLSAVS